MKEVKILGKTYIEEESNVCYGCDLEDICLDIPNKYFPGCASAYRSDGKNVIFVEKGK